MIRIYLIIVITFISISTDLFAVDELIVIKSVSKSKKSFAIRKGKQDGIFEGQISLFSNNKSSFTARVVEISRYYSVWKLQEKNATCPFLKGQIVNYSNTVENIWTKVSMLNFLNQKTKVKFQHFKKENDYSRTIFSGSFSNALIEDVPEIEEYEIPKRQSYNLELLYITKLDEIYQLGFGIRYDNENAIKDSPELTIITKRLFAQVAIYKNFAIDPFTQNRYYIGAAIGFGSSQTEIVEDVKKGSSYLLPSLKAGRKFNSTGKYSFFAEFSLDNIQSNETFLDGELQTTKILASKITLGISI